MPRRYLTRNALTAASAALGLSGCTGRAAYSGVTKVIEQPPMMHGRRHSAIAGVANIPVTVAAKRLCRNTPSLLCLRSSRICRLRVKEVVERSEGAMDLCGDAIAVSTLVIANVAPSPAKKPTW